MHRLLITATLTLFLLSPALAQQPAAPSTSPPTGAEPKPKPKLYDESADPKQQIASAIAAAKRDHSRVLIQWGGNWCPWCIRMGELMKSNKDIAHTLQYEYILIHVAIGQSNGKNGDLLDTYQTKAKTEGFPYLTVLDEGGKVVANQETESLEVKDDDGKSAGVKAGHDPAKLLAFLNKHKAAPVEAQSILDKGLAEAKSAGKTAFVHFGAPWCPWCHVLENWMAKPEVAALLAKDFIDVKIDQDRFTGGKAMLTKLCGKENIGIPWFVFMDSAGKPIADSTAAKGNIGFPTEPAEIEHFGAMLKKAAKNLTPKDIDALLSSLKSDKSATH